MKENAYGLQETGIEPASASAESSESPKRALTLASLTRYTDATLDMETRAGSQTPDTGQDTPASTPLSALEAAARLGVNERTIRRAIAPGALAASKQRGLFRVTPEALNRPQASDAHPPPPTLA